MKKTNLFRRIALGFMATVALLASAQGVNEMPFLKKWNPTPEQKADILMKAPLNTEKPKGAYMFGSMLDDYNLLRNFASMHVNEPGKLNKLKLVCDPDPDNWMYEQLFGVMAGCYGGDGYYYGYRLKMYTLVNYLFDFIKVNPYTGEFETVRAWTDQTQHGVTQCYDMAYNPQDDQIYGIAPDPDSANESAVRSMIGTVDRRTGEFKKLAPLSRYYFAIAFDYDGNLYGITWIYRAEANGGSSITGARLDQLDDEFEYMKGTTLMVDEKPFKPYYQHGLEFDYTTGDLYWTACAMEDHRQSLVRINPDNGKTENLGTVGMMEQMLGLYIPFVTADSRTAPARVSNLTYAIDPQGANKTTLSWTNPTTQWNRKDLNDIVEINIYRDDMKSAPVGTVAAAGMKGKQMSWTDETAERGIHKYYVVPSSVKGQAGIMDSISAFVGRDLPGSPLNVAASSADGKTVSLKWDAPDRGDSDGWFDADAITYTVTRTQDGKVIAQDIKKCSAEDKDIPEATTYTYAVVAKNNEGASEPGLSNGVLAGQSLKVPFSTNFPNDTEAGRFTQIDKNGDGMKFYYSSNNNIGGGVRSYVFILSDYTNDDLLVSPPISVKDGHTYRVTYTISVGRYGEYDMAWTQDFRIVGGMNPTVDDLEDVYADYPGFVFDNMYDRKTVSAEFTADHEGDQYVALNVYTTSTIKDTWLYVENFKLEEVFDNDLGVDKLETAGIVSNVEDDQCPNVFNVTVHNPGMKTQSDYKVEVGFRSLAGDFIPFAEASEVPAVAHNEKKVVVVNGFPKDVEDGNYQLAARVALEGDEFDANDMSELMPVQVDGNSALNYTVSKNPVTDETNTPMSFYTPYSAYQTIYSPEMMSFEMEDDDVAKLKRIAWQYNSDRDIAGTEVKLYLGQTAVKTIESGSKEWVVSNQEKVFDGKIDIKKGNGFMDIVLDTPFEFDPEMSLVVTVVKYNNSLSGEFPVRFKVFDYAQKSLKTWHTMGYRGNNPFDLNSYSAFETFSYPQAPVLYLSVPGAMDGVCVVGADNDSQVVFENGQLSFGALDVREVSVWSVDGKLVKNGAVANGAVALDLLPGIYVVNATLADGEVVTLKVRANR